MPPPLALQLEKNKKGVQKEKYFQWLFIVSEEQLLPEGYIQLAHSLELDKSQKEPTARTARLQSNRGGEHLPAKL